MAGAEGNGQRSGRRRSDHPTGLDRKVKGCLGSAVHAVVVVALGAAAVVVGVRRG